MTAIKGVEKIFFVTRGVAFLSSSINVCHRLYHDALDDTTLTAHRCASSTT